MRTLVIHAPQHKVKGGGASFGAILSSGVGPEYAIYESIISKLSIPGSTVVLLDKDQELRAEGVLVKLVRTPRRIPNAWRYNVHVEKWTTVSYKSEELNRCGVALL